MDKLSLSIKIFDFLLSLIDFLSLLSNLGNKGGLSPSPPSQIVVYYKYYDVKRIYVY